MENTTSSRNAPPKFGNGSQKLAHSQYRSLIYKGVIRLAFEEAARDRGYDVPENVRGPMMSTKSWSGPRDRA